MIDIINEIPSKRVKKNEDQIRAAIRTGLDETQIFLIQSHLNTIDGLTKKLEEIDSEIKHRISGRKDDLQIAMSYRELDSKPLQLYSQR